MKSFYFIFVFILMVFPAVLLSAAWENRTNTRVAIIDFTIKPSDSNFNAAGFTELLQSSFQKKNAFILIERKEIEQIIKLQKLEMSGMTENSAVMIGKLKSVQKVLTGSVTVVDRQYYLNIRSIDVVTAVVDASYQERFNSLREMFESTDRIAGQFIRSIDGLEPLVRPDSFKREIMAGLNDFLKLYPDSIIACYPFSGSGRDVSSNKNHGEVNNAQATNDRFGNPRAAYYMSQPKGSRIVGIQTNTSPVTLTLMVWFKTETSGGGRMAGFSSSFNWMSAVKDRHIYMHESGRIYCGIALTNDGRLYLSSLDSYNDGEWHLAAMTYSSADGLKLYVDSELTVEKPGVPDTMLMIYEGFWRIGYDQMNMWPGEPRYYSFEGLLDDILVLDRVLNSSEIKAYYNIGGFRAE